jgi:hypothetical protein
LFIAVGMTGVLRYLDMWYGAGRRRVAVCTGVLVVLATASPFVLYRATPRVLRMLGASESHIGIPQIGSSPVDRLAYFLDPDQRGDDSAARFGLSTLRQVAPDAVVLAAWPDDQEGYIVLRYFQLVDGMRPDVRLDLLLFASEGPVHTRVLERVQATQGCHPLYLLSLNPELYPLDRLRSEFEIVPEANVYRLIPRAATADQRVCSGLPQPANAVSLEQLIRRALR